MNRNFKLGIDRIKCDGHALCAELLPELISLDDWGYPIITGDPIPAYLMPHAQRAVEGCPVLALTMLRAERQRAGGR